MFPITVDDRAVQAALTRLTLRATNLQPILQSLGEDLMERSKKRFASSTAPDGTRWAANARATVEAFVRRKGHAVRSPRGVALAAHKKPLIGDSGSLRQQFHVRSSPASVIVANSMRYAAIQQLGGRKAVYRQLWGDIPARPFLPVKADGSLYPAEQSLILAALQSFLERA
jgi:phage virion morphogenesis protein